MLSSGNKLGPYEIQELLGAGGMGEVYRARDTRLDRAVAIKIMPSHLSNAGLKERFEREARAISSLSHPHICVLHDVGHQDGIDFLVMELLEGQTLSDRLSKGALPIDQALRFGTQIADALDKAHRQGIVHRDLKPGNIMLTKSGVKLLDFGLAKLQPSVLESQSGISVLPTEHHDLTKEGTILGTIQYMAPEQLEGREIDGRTDIFAFGSVLYEMITGKKAFTGKSQASLISAILSVEPPPISEIQPLAPQTLDHLVKKCLAKDPDERWQSARDVRSELNWISQSTQAAIPARPVATQRKTNWLVPALIALIGATAFLFFYQTRNKSPELYPRIVRAAIPPPSGLTFNFIGDNAGPVMVSPDGADLAFVATNEEGENLLWVRSLESGNLQSLPGTKGAVFPFWSADSKSLGFFANSKLKRVDLNGGSATPICDAVEARGGAWNAEGIILFTSSFRSGLQRVSANGGNPVPVTTLDQSKHTSHRWPVFLPDGNHFVYLAVNHDPTLQDNNGIYVSSLSGKDSKLIVSASSNAAYSDGKLLFLNKNTLFAQPFDPNKLELHGTSFPIADNVHYWDGTWNGVFSASQNGILAYQVGADQTSNRVEWRDRTGKNLGLVAEKIPFSGIELSPHDNKLAMMLGESQDIWILDAATGTKTRFTTNPKIETKPIWSPDETELAYSINSTFYYSVYAKSVSGFRTRELLPDVTGLDRSATDWSSDGRYLLYDESSISSPEIGSIWVLPVSGIEKAFILVKGAYNGRFSPDGKYVAYVSVESGRKEVYVTPFPSAENKWQVSVDGGDFPRWRNNGQELFYISLNQRMKGAQVTYSASGFHVENVKDLFDCPFLFPANVILPYPYDVTSDGQRFVVNYSPRENAPPITLVINWTKAK